MARHTEQDLNRRIELATAGIAPADIAKELASLARSELASAIREGEGSSIYDKFVNGRQGADEGTVEPPGPIVYLFQWWTEIVEFGLQTLIDRSPERSGLYKRSWFAMVGGVVVTDYATIPIDAEVVLTNNQPYSRKINVGFMEMSVPPGVVEDAKKIVSRRFGNLIETKATMITLPGGYILKGVFKRGVREFSRKKLRKDTMAGAQMTYPSLVLKMRD